MVKYKDLKRKFIVTIIIVLLISCIDKKQNEVINNESEVVFSLKKGKTGEFKVQELDSIENVYLILVTNKNGSFKILTSKLENQEGCEKVKIGSYYNFDLRNVFDDQINAVEIDGVLYNGVEVLLEKDAKTDLYYCSNLAGLCFIE